VPGASRLLARCRFATINNDLRASDGTCLARREPKTRNAGDARQRFAAKSKCADGFEVRSRADLARGVPFEREQGIIAILPEPSSITRTNEMPPRRIKMSILRAPASMLFSTSSFTTERAVPPLRRPPPGWRQFRAAIECDSWGCLIL